MEAVTYAQKDEGWPAEVIMKGFNIVHDETGATVFDAYGLPAYKVEFFHKKMERTG